MAGGRGLRLRELTDHQPKPLVPVGGKPMLESIIEHYVAQGFRRFWLCLGYRGDLIKTYFGDGSRLGAQMRYVTEHSPMGTGGALALLPQWDRPFIVTNADVLSDHSAPDMMEAHARSGADLTMAVWRHEHQVPYGVAQIDETQRLVSLDEKPVKQWAINAGIYVVNPEALARAPAGAFDMTDFMGRLEHIHAYPIEGQWHDVGTLDELDRVNNVGRWAGKHEGNDG